MWKAYLLHRREITPVLIKAVLLDEEIDGLLAIFAQALVGIVVLRGSQPRRARAHSLLWPRPYQARRALVPGPCGGVVH